MTNQTREIIKALEKAQKSIYNRRRYMKFREEEGKFLFDTGIKRGLRKAELILRRHIKRLKSA